MGRAGHVENDEAGGTVRFIREATGSDIDSFAAFAGFFGE